MVSRRKDEISKNIIQDILITHDKVKYENSIKGEKKRTVIGIFGPHGSEKSVFISKLLDNFWNLKINLNIIPISGYRLSNKVLSEKRISFNDVSDESFDLSRYAEDIERAKHITDRSIYIPAYLDDSDQPVAQAVEIKQSDDIIITWGENLGSLSTEWSDIRKNLDRIYYLDKNKYSASTTLIFRFLRSKPSYLSDSDVFQENCNRANRDIAAVAFTADRIIKLQDSIYDFSGILEDKRLELEASHDK